MRNKNITLNKCVDSKIHHNSIRKTGNKLRVQAKKKLH